MDCIGYCKQGALTYAHRSKSSVKEADESVDKSRRQFLTVSTILAGTAVLKAEEKTVDGGLATIIDKGEARATDSHNSSGKPQHSQLHEALHIVSALCEQLPQRCVASFDRTGHVHAA